MKQGSENRKKLLILGGKPIGSCELVRAAKKEGIYTIVADYLETDKSPAKQIADEAWLLSTADLDSLEEMAYNIGIDGVLSGVHEFNIEKMIGLCERLAFPCYCNAWQWELCTNKARFKNLCRLHGIPVTPEYDINVVKKAGINYPIVTKPADSSGSRGFSICDNEKDFISGYEKALSFSESKLVLIEKYMPYDTVIIHYTLINGDVYFSGMSEKKSMQLMEYGSSVMALQLFPSPYIDIYLEKLDKKVKTMFANIGLHDGPIWIEAFNNDGEFVLNEMGYRFGGSLTYYPVHYFYGIDQLKIMIQYAVHGNENNVFNYDSYIVKPNNKENYCILPLHLKPGIIRSIYGEKEIKHIPSIYAYVPVHFVGDEIGKWGTAQQVFCYLHIVFSTTEELKETIYNVLRLLYVYSINNENLLFCLFDVDSL
ncbi:MAG: ATP-grasp domain-containing protein [Natronincolaceae bacterium]|jgi:biotin carboxylase